MKIRLGEVTNETNKGEADTKPAEWMLIPLRGRCKICNTKHEPEEPHNATMLFYKIAFKSLFGRLPTWADALAHCDPVMQHLWREQLQIGEMWTEPPEGEAPIRHFEGGEDAT